MALIGGLIVGTVTTFVIIPWLIPKLLEKGIAGIDWNKPSKPKIAEMGGIAVVIGFFAGISTVMMIDGIENTDLLYVSLSAILGAAFLGILDDMFELRQRQKAFFPFLLALPLGAVLDPEVYIPFIGLVDFGPFMLIAAPFAVSCAANAGNMLEGFNGLGVGLGIIMASTLVILSFHHDRLDGVCILAPLIGCLIAFLWFNKYPARIFPGDTLMLFMGAALAVAGMLSSLYIQTTVIFFPMIIEFFLKLRGHFRGENYSTHSSNGRLGYSGRIESLTHILMRRTFMREPVIVALLWCIEALLCAIVITVDLLI